jgi:amino acid transporter
MKGSGKLSVYVGTFIFVIVGYLVMQIVSDFLSDIFGNLNIDFLTPLRIGLIVVAIGWFLVCFLTYWGSTRWLDEGERSGLLSLFFVIVWLSASLGILIAIKLFFMFQGGTLVLDLDDLINTFFVAMPLALAPTIAAILGVSNKA